MSTPRRNKAARPLAIGLIVLATFAVGAAIFVVGTPMQQRKERIDERRAEALRSLSREVLSYADDHDATLPPSLDALQRPGLRLALNDPETGAPYRYGVVDARTFELCADFKTDSALSAAEHRPDTDWAHGVGPTCFTRKLPDKKKEAGSTAADLLELPQDAAVLDGP
jgi:hypothetical protein